MAHMANGSGGHTEPRCTADGVHPEALRNWIRQDQANDGERSLAAAVTGTHWPVGQFVMLDPPVWWRAARPTVRFPGRPLLLRRRGPGGLSGALAMASRARTQARRV